MQLSRLLFFLALALSPVALISTTWLYLYPLFHGCNFAAPSYTNATTARDATAPFRLLALGDPQLEGDSSLPKPGVRAFPSLRFTRFDLQHTDSWYGWFWILRRDLKKAVARDLPRWLEGYRKRIDLWGNDWYLAHIVRQLSWWTQPSHVAVLGDLLGSQWIGDEEFERRADRYWGTVFKGFEKVPEEVMQHSEEQGGRKWGQTTEVLGQDEGWVKRVINIAGNHDIGYAGDLDEGRIGRFEKAFGRVNWDITFKLPNRTQDSEGAQQNEGVNREGQDPVLRLVVLNSMNLDTPAYSEGLQRETYDFMNHIITTSLPVTDKTHATILLTHIPMHKEPGICVDDPYFNFFDTGSGVQEQNMLSPHSSKMILEGIFGLSGNPHAAGQGFGRRGIVINGHDHEGCDVLHYISKKQFECHPVSFSEDTPREILDAYGNKTSSESEHPEWRALRIPSQLVEQGDCIPRRGIPRLEEPSIREVTLRSMMGDFSGYAGFVSAWFDESIGEHGEWQLEFNTCGVGVQHWWWAVHVVDLILLVAITCGALANAVEHLLGTKQKAKEEKGGQEKADVKGGKKTQVEVKKGEGGTKRIKNGDVQKRRVG
jgi:hypothetical protein